ncbi:hypothetical protein KR009_004950, partial [Drosophila setifemur]
DDIDTCTKWNGFKVEEANAVLEVWPANLDVSKVNRTHKCYVRCLLVYFGTLSFSGEVLLDKYFDAGILDEFAVGPIVQRCRYQYKDEPDHCEHAFGIFNCFRNEHLINS